jgi:hypothetical protein
MEQHSITPDKVNNNSYLKQNKTKQNKHETAAAGGSLSRRHLHVVLQPHPRLVRPVVEGLGRVSAQLLSVRGLNESIYGKGRVDGHAAYPVRKERARPGRDEMDGWIDRQKNN